MRQPYTQRASLHQRAGGDPLAARSTVYAWHQSLSLLAELEFRGLVRDYRDRDTGRKIRSAVREMSRLAPPGYREDWSQAARDDLAAIYLEMRDMPLAAIRTVCREVRKSVT